MSAVKDLTFEENGNIIRIPIVLPWDTTKFSPSKYYATDLSGSREGKVATTTKLKEKAKGRLRLKGAQEVKIGMLAGIIRRERE
jgi:hypothetical protein